MDLRAVIADSSSVIAGLNIVIAGLTRNLFLLQVFKITTRMPQ
jgi:hypothetical protein